MFNVSNTLILLSAFPLKTLMIIQVIVEKNVGAVESEDWELSQQKGKADDDSIYYYRRELLFRRNYYLITYIHELYL